MEITTEGQKMTMYSLVDGDWVYQWGNSFMGNTKMNLKELEKLDDGQEIQAEEDPQSYDQELDLHLFCLAGHLDNLICCVYKFYVFG